MAPAAPFLQEQRTAAALLRLAVLRRAELKQAWPRRQQRRSKLICGLHAVRCTMPAMLWLTAQRAARSAVYSPQTILRYIPRGKYLSACAGAHEMILWALVLLAGVHSCVMQRACGLWGVCYALGVCHALCAVSGTRQDPSGRVIPVGDARDVIAGCEFRISLLFVMCV